MPLSFLSPLHKAYRQIGVHLEEHTRSLGVSPNEGHLLTYLKSYAPIPVGEIVAVFGIKQSTLTSMLNRLETAGLVRREINREDLRSFLIALTDHGSSVADRLDASLVAFEAEIRQRVTPEEVAGFEAVMAAIGDVTKVELRRS